MRDNLISIKNLTAKEQILRTISDLVNEVSGNLADIFEYQANNPNDTNGVPKKLRNPVCGADDFMVCYVNELDELVELYKDTFQKLSNNSGFDDPDYLRINEKLKSKFNLN